MEETGMEQASEGTDRWRIRQAGHKQRDGRGRGKRGAGEEIGEVREGQGKRGKRGRASEKSEGQRKRYPHSPRSQSSYCHL